MTEKEKQKKVYVVIMRRYGNPDAHSYVLGVYSSREAAKEYGDTEEGWRAGKYKSVVEEFNVDESPEGMDDIGDDAPEEV